MAKYDPLNRYLRRQSATEVALTFPEIENLLNAFLPKTAQRAEWWSNESAPGTQPVQARAWLAAGYHADPAPARERVIFRKASGPASVAAPTH